MRRPNPTLDSMPDKRQSRRGGGAAAVGGPVRRLANAGLGYARFGGFTPGLATELLIKAEAMADLPAAQAAAVAEACAEEAGVFTLEAAQEEALWTDALAQAGLLVDVPAEAVRKRKKRPATRYATWRATDRPGSSSMRTGRCGGTMESRPQAT